MDHRSRRGLQFAAAALALVVAGTHLLHPTLGGHALLVYAAVGQLGDPRPLLFAVGSFALLFGVVSGFNGFAGKPLYLGGIVVALAFALGFGVWHTVLDHGAFWPHIESRGSHGGNPIVIVLEHLLNDRIAMLSVIAEVGLVGCLSVLYYTTEEDSDGI